MIPFHKPLEITEDILKDFKMVLDRRQLSNNFLVKQLEYDIGKLYNKKYVIACSSGSQALMIVLFCSGTRNVWLPSFTWFSVKYVCDLLKLDQKFKDITPYTWHINKQNYLDENRVIIGLHTFGSIDIIDRENVIYDGTHALGTKIKDFGMATVFSMAPTKLMTACEGGIIITEYPGLFTQMREMRDKISRMSELNALVGLYNLKHLDKVLEWKHKLYDYYQDKIPGRFQLIHYNSNYNTIGFFNLESLKIPNDIETKQYYVPLKRGLKNTDQVYKNMVCLPSWYGVDYKLIVDKILEVNKE